MAPIGNKNALGNTGGRPGKYKEEYVHMAGELALLGLTDKQMASFFKVSEKHFNKWKKQYPEFGKSIEIGKLPSDAKVASSLFKRALGYSYLEETFEKIDSKVNLEITSAADIVTEDAYKKKVVTKEVIPDVTAQKFWLMNRQRKSWTDHQDIHNTLDLNFLEKMSDENLDLIIQKLIDKQKASHEQE